MTDADALSDAADEIDGLKAEIERLRAALRVARPFVAKSTDERAASALAAIDFALGDEQNVDDICPHCNKVRRPGRQCCQGGF